MLRFREQVPLSTYSSYKIGGPARYFFTARDEASLKAALKEARRRKLRTFIMGGATNLLIPDAGFDGLVIHCAFKGMRRKGNTITAGAGVKMAELVRFAAREGLSGLEWAGGLPGSFGGAIRGNAGAFKGETKDSVRSVRSIDTRTLTSRTRARAGCRFAYRTSIYKEMQGGEMVLSATLALKPGDPKAIRKATREKIAYRQERHPMEYPNIGSIFKNVPVASVPQKWRERIAYEPKLDPIPVVPAARLINLAGLKGRARNGAMISLKHPNFIVNTGGARAADVLFLIALVQRTIKKKFGVEMEPEVQLL